MSLLGTIGGLAGTFFGGPEGGAIGTAIGNGVGDLFGSSAVSGITGYLGTQSTNQTNLDIAQNNSAFNAQEAQKNRDFQAQQVTQQEDFQRQSILDAENYSSMMSNSAYQRAVKDMQAAGLNPMLAYSQGGASAPQGPTSAGAAAGGAQATAVQPAPMANPWVQAIQSANQAANIQATNAAAEQAHATADREKATAENIRVQTPGYQGEQNARVDLIRRQADLAVQQADVANATRDKARAEIENITKTGKNIDADTMLRQVNATLAAYGINAARAESNKSGTWWGQTISPWLPSIHSADSLLRLIPK